MGRIISRVKITNALDPFYQIECNALIDTGASGPVLPRAWKERLGKFHTAKIIKMETADQRIVSGEVCGPVQIQIEGFDSIFNEVVFLDMEPTNGRYKPLIGYIILEQSRIAVDVIGHRLIQVKYMDLKRLLSSRKIESIVPYPLKGDLPL